MRESRRGYVFLQALIAVTALVAFMVMLAANERASLQNTQNRLRQRRADAAADAGLARALAAINDANTSIVGLNDEWAQLGNTGANVGFGGDEEFDLGSDSTFRVQLIDAGSLINVNNDSASQLEQLPLDQQQVDCLQDWIETGTTARSDGAKDSYYNALPQPYNTKLGPLTTVDELLLIDNWTGTMLYQPPTVNSTITMPTDLDGNTLPLVSLLTVDSEAPNTQASGTARINLSTGVTATTLERLGVSTPIANRLAPGGRRRSFPSFAALFSAVPGMDVNTEQILLNVAGFTTATTVQGKLNLNTVTEPVLDTVPTMTTDVAGTIVQQQQGLGFQTLGQLATVPGMTPARVGQLADRFVIGSDTWLVHIYGASGGVGTAIEAVVGMRAGVAQTISWSRVYTGSIPAWWGWESTVNAVTDAGNVQ